MNFNKKENNNFLLTNLKNLYQKESEIEENANLITLNNLFFNLKIKNKGEKPSEDEKRKEYIKKIQKKLLKFLYEITLDNIFLGNELPYITDYDIYWDKKEEIFSYSSMQL